MAAHAKMTHALGANPPLLQTFIILPKYGPEQRFCYVLLFGFVQHFGRGDEAGFACDCRAPGRRGADLRRHIVEAAEQGYKTGILDSTAGEMGTKGTPETRLKEVREGRSDSARSAPRKSAAAGRACGSHDRDEAGCRKAHSRAQASHRDPSLLGGRHPDHYTAARLAYEGCFLAGLKQLPIEGEAFARLKSLFHGIFS